ncbi:MAG: hypothetical protein IKP17_02130 [Oscillospiraceae bacterium]|nr:hypothetical protein [Oscillospiraceae bacterium]MBR4691536.1 hypothetical protein [Oscillospiraceae bacterium]
MKNRIFTLALALLLVLCLSLPALADTGYTGEINPETGEPYGEDAVRDTGDRVALSGSMYYDWTTHDYVYPIPGSLGEVHVGAADGMVLTSPVAIVPGTDTSVTVHHNGSEYKGNLYNCSEAGEYVISALVGGTTRRLMSFTLVGRSTSVLHTFVVPDGFYIIDAMREGESVYVDRYSVDMEAEGLYSIEYECSATNLVYKLETTIDRTPPSLSFRGKVDPQGRVRSKVEFEGLQYGDTIYMTRSGTAAAPELKSDGTGVVYDPGAYAMIVTDAAGNSVEYDFIILQYLDLQSWAFFLLVLAIFAAVISYIIVRRKRLKIG